MWILGIDLYIGDSHRYLGWVQIMLMSVDILKRVKVWVLRPAMDIVENFMSSELNVINNILSFLNSFNSSVASIPN